MNTCRICLIRSNEMEFKSVFSNGKNEVKISEMITSCCSSVQIEVSDDFPKTVCEACVMKLCHFFDFKNLILASDSKLRSNLEVFKKESPINDNHSSISKKVTECDDTCDENIKGTHENLSSPLTNPEVFSNNSLTTDKQLKAVAGRKTEKTRGKQKVEKKDVKIFKCHQCDKEYKTRFHLQVHNSNNHSGLKQFVCETCNKAFSMRWVLNVHQRVHTGERPYSCEKCGKCFRFTSALLNHLRIHSGIKPYKCNICGKAFTQSGGLKVHERTHTGEKPFCCEMCSRGFSEKAKLQIHLRSHTRERTEPCPTCGKLFPHVTQMRKHLKTHLGEKPFRCEVCDARFTANNSLKVHGYIHEGIRPFACKLCGKSFTQANCIMRHMKTHITKPHD